MKRHGQLNWPLPFCVGNNLLTDSILLKSHCNCSLRLMVGFWRRRSAFDGGFCATHSDESVCKCAVVDASFEDEVEKLFPASSPSIVNDWFVELDRGRLTLFDVTAFTASSNSWCSRDLTDAVRLLFERPVTANESTSVVKGGRPSPRIVDANEESPLGVRFSSILHPRSEGKDRRKWSVCVWIATQKIYLANLKFWAPENWKPALAWIYTKELVCFLWDPPPKKQWFWICRSKEQKAEQPALNKDLSFTYF